MLKIKQGKATLLIDDLNEFLYMCKLKNLSPSTIRTYTQQFQYFLNHLDNNGVSATEDITQQHINTYIEALLSKDITIVSINTALRNIKVVLNYFISEELLSNKIKITAVKDNNQDNNNNHRHDNSNKRRYYTREEIEVLLKQPNTSKCSYNELRNWTMVCFLISTGCRVSTLINIRLQDIDFINMMIHFRHMKSSRAEATSRTQQFPLSKELNRVLKTYIRNTEGLDEILFPSTSNTMLHQSSVYHAIEKYNKSRGVEVCGLHMFRHTFAREMVLRGVSSITLKRLMGHASIAMTERYVQLYGEDLRGSVDEYDILRRTSANALVKKVYR
ncbi:MAG: tyrosine-type recombinase/integrase [Peptococcaceae bacterium]|nr:tyrosine-type recombinase/integrase [Peptococcaceae bacterium]